MEKMEYFHNIYILKNRYSFIIEKHRKLNFSTLIQNR